LKRASGPLIEEVEGGARENRNARRGSRSRFAGARIEPFWIDLAQTDAATA
jgi:hypothetical protein